MKLCCIFRPVALAGAVIGLFGAHALSQAPDATQRGTLRSDVDVNRMDRLAWWHEAKFGMFIHWGPSSQLAGVWNGQPVGGFSEWIMHDARIPIADYVTIAGKFNPVRFDANEWVRIAKNAGMKYIVITSKHHDGFAMFPSAISPFNIYDATSFKRDPLRELSNAAKKEGIRLGFYYSQAQDWHHRGGAGGGWDPAQAGDMTQYVRRIAVPQIKELLTNYPDVAVVWWDTPFGMTSELAAPLASQLKLQPNVITNDRLGGGYGGDYATLEQTIPAVGMAAAWETAMTMNDAWGYKALDDNWKPTQTLLRNLVDIVSKGGNYLLNVGPTGEGIIPPPSVQRLAEMGAWLRINGEAIYGAAASPFKPFPWGRVTVKQGRIYAHVFETPPGGEVVLPVQNTPKRVFLLGNPDAPIASTRSATGVTIQLPATPPDPYPTVFVAEIDEDVIPIIPVAGISNDADGSITLKAIDATIVGETARLNMTAEPSVEYWTNVADYLTWTVHVARPGRFSVRLTYACDPGSAGSAFSLLVGNQSLEGQIRSTGGWSTYVALNLGSLNITKAGTVTVVLKPKRNAGTGVMNFRALRLQPQP